MAMMNVRQYFLDTLVELTGVTSGLAVSIRKTSDLLDNGITADACCFTLRLSTSDRTSSDSPVSPGASARPADLPEQASWWG